MPRARQLSLLPRPEIQHGSDYRKGRRKQMRPFEPKKPIHLTLKSSQAQGDRSLLKPARKWHVHALLLRISERRQVKVYRYANVGNHLHLIVQAKTRKDFQAFLREFAGAVALSVTGAIKGRPGKFWDSLAWSKVIEWGRHFKNATRYILLNVLEGSGLRDRALLARLENEGVVLLTPD